VAAAAAALASMTDWGMSFGPVKAPQAKMPGREVATGVKLPVVTKRCGACAKVCPTGAINFEDTEERRTLNVGSVVLAPGFRSFDPTGMDIYGYDQFPNVVTSLEFERILSATGPFGGHLVKPSAAKKGTAPRKIA
jgi:heterodisulfide reductase subunit A